MALIRCPDCALQVSDLAPVCPHCGRPLPARPATVEQGIKEDGQTVAQASEAVEAGPATPAKAADPATPTAPAEAPPTEPPKGVEPAARPTPLTMSNGIAVFCGLLIPGLGQLVQGRPRFAFVIFSGAAVCWALVAANMADQVTGKTISQPAAFLALGIQLVGLIGAAVWREPKMQAGK